MPVATSSRPISRPVGCPTPGLVPSGRSKCAANAASAGASGTENVDPSTTSTRRATRAVAATCAAAASRAHPSTAYSSSTGSRARASQ